MDAVEFLKEGTRMCNSYEACVGCPMYPTDDCCMVKMNLKQMINIVEKWAKEHPVKTRQSEFLKQWPDARIESDGMPSICPIVVDKRCYNKDDDALCCFVRDEEKCRKCRRDFWLKEIK